MYTCIILVPFFSFPISIFVYRFGLLSMWKHIFEHSAGKFSQLMILLVFLSGVLSFSTFFFPP